MRVGIAILLFCLVQGIANAQFAAKSIVNLGGGDIPEQVETADLDGDGKLDVISKPMFENKLFWMKNNGDGTFYDTGKKLTGGFATLVSLEAFDYDKDGDQDVVGAYKLDYEGRVVLWKNSGDGNFSAATPLISGLSEIAEITPVDIDKDGDVDIALATPYERIKWLENKLSTNSWQIHDFDFDIIARHLDFLDFDKNNTLDVLSVSGSVRLNGVEIAITPGVYMGYARFVKGVDLDRDGDNDIVVAQLGYSDGLFWLENDNNQFIRHMFESTAGKSYNDLTVFDFDNDGDEDVFADCWFDCGLTLWENTGAGTFVLKTGLGGNGIEENELKHADIDNDGKIDIIRNDGGIHAVLWYKNNQTPFDGLTADFTYEGVCEDASFTFNHKSRGRDIVSYEWDFGDGSAKGNTPTASHVYASAGDYTVKLTIKNGTGQSNSVSKSITVRPRPAKDDDRVVAFCVKDNSSNIVVTLPAGFTYKWSYDDQQMNVFNATTSYTFTWGQDSYVSKTNNFGCTADGLQKISVVKYDDPAPPVPHGAVSYRGEAELTLQATPKFGEVIQWVELGNDEPYHAGNTLSFTARA